MEQTKRKASKMYEYFHSEKFKPKSKTVFIFQKKMGILSILP